MNNPTQAEKVSFPSKSNAARSSFRALLLFCCLAVPWTDAAKAACVRGPGPGTVLWSFPEDGAVDVPVNAKLWLRFQNLSLGEVHLNGEPVPFHRKGFNGLFIVPTLKPDTDYELVLSGAPDEVPAKIQFRTGSSYGAAPSDVEVEKAHIRKGYPQDLSPLCAAVLSGQDCFDTGQNTLISFEMAGDEPVAWLIAETMRRESLSAIWPVECGMPSIFTHAWAVDQIGFSITPISRGGIDGRSTLWNETERKIAAVSEVVACEGADAAVPRRVVHRSEPRVSSLSREGQVTGDVLLRAEVAGDGRVIGIEIVEDFVFGLGARAEQAVLGWRFEPQDTESTQVCLKIHYPGADA